jgi:hypothetical protein
VPDGVELSADDAVEGAEESVLDCEVVDFELFSYRSQREKEGKEGEKGRT